MSPSVPRSRPATTDARRRCQVAFRAFSWFCACCAEGQDTGIWSCVEVQLRHGTVRDGVRRLEGIPRVRRRVSCRRLETPPTGVAGVPGLGVGLRFANPTYAATTSVPVLFPGTVYLIRLSANPDQVLTFALAADPASGGIAHMASSAKTPATAAPSLISPRPCSGTAPDVRLFPW